MSEYAALPRCVKTGEPDEGSATSAQNPLALSCFMIFSAHDMNLYTQWNNMELESHLDQERFFLLFHFMPSRKYIDLATQSLHSGHL